MAKNKARRKNNNVVSIDEYSNTPQRYRKKNVEVIPRNQNQEDYLFAIEDYSIVFGVGPAGTGKTLLATLAAIHSLRSGLIERIIITRPAISVDEQHGYLPGNLIEKMAPWTRPIFDVFEEYFSPKQIEKMIEEGVIEIAPLAYMRGRTFKNSFIIFDESQNSTPEQMKMVLTRIGEGSKIVITGDPQQHDRGYEKNGLKDFTDKIKEDYLNNVHIVNFTKNDVERSEVVEEVLKVYKES